MSKNLRKSDGKRITCVGDFYGNPTAGIIVYRLSEPFEEYMYDKDAMQWMSVEYAEEIGVFT